MLVLPATKPRVLLKEGEVWGHCEAVAFRLSNQSASRKLRLPSWQKNSQKPMAHKTPTHRAVEPLRTAQKTATDRRKPRGAKRCCASLSWPRSEFSICTNLKILSTCSQGYCYYTLRLCDKGWGGYMSFLLLHRPKLATTLFLHMPARLHLSHRRLHPKSQHAARLLGTPVFSGWVGEALRLL